MTIKHLVISGGGPMGFQFIGCLQYLNEHNFWSIENIESIYATSIGTIISIFIALRYDWETINKYIIERPWKEIFILTGKQIFEAYYNKGLFGKKVFESILKPILEAKDLSLNITMKDFYDHCKIEMHLFTFELNSFKTVDISYKSHPNLLLVDAVCMSSAIPGMFAPICLNNECYIDGALMANYPLSYCLESEKERENGSEWQHEILGIKYNIVKDLTVIKEKDCTNEQKIVENFNNINNDSSILDFIMGFSTKAINFINTIIKVKKIKNEIIFELHESPLSLHYVKSLIESVDMRKEFVHKGYAKAKEFLDNLQSGQDLSNKLG